MSDYYPFLCKINIASIIFKMILATICGGVIGLQRGKKGRPAGFRTHILVCIGSVLAMMTNQYISETIGGTDTARLGAQVISGVGFLGAGTIIVTSKNQVKGLTTAAGLWASACMGLAIGIGFYEAAIISCIMIFIVSTLFYRIDYFITSRSKIGTVYIEFEDIRNLSMLISELKKINFTIIKIEISNDDLKCKKTSGAILTIKNQNKKESCDIIELAINITGIKFVEIL
ncbi:MgtC/SapB family protein [Sedimentibacter sp. zth1]|nr:MgtC/SapB family protein [Sedimentibacter sp. zth1]